MTEPDDAMRNPERISIHRVRDGWVVADGGGWREGVYESPDEALGVALGRVPEKPRVPFSTSRERPCPVFYDGEHRDGNSYMPDGGCVCGHSSVRTPAEPSQSPENADDRCRHHDPVTGLRCLRKRMTDTSSICRTPHAFITPKKADFDPGRYGAAECSVDGCTWCTSDPSGLCTEHRQSAEGADRG